MKIGGVELTPKQRSNLMEVVTEAFADGMKLGIRDGIRFGLVAGLGVGVMGTMLTQFIFHWSLR